MDKQIISIKSDRMKLQWKIFMFLLAFCGILLSILWLFQTILLPQTYKVVRLYQIDKAIELVDAHINSPELNDILYNLQVEDDIMVTLAMNFQAPPKMKDRVETITKEKQYILGDGTPLRLVFHAVITPVDATIATLKVQLYVITIIMILASVILALSIAKRVAKPIEKMNKNAKKLAEGDYAITFSASEFLEIKELSDTLNIATVELSRSERLRRELLANISHDLRTPLALIYSYAEMMHDFPEEITSDQTRMIMDETARLSSLVNDVMDISKLESGNMTPNMKQYNLTKNLEESIERMAHLIQSNGYTLNFECDEEIIIYGDEVKLSQVFYNLLINAINYGGDDKSITVRQIKKENSVRVEVIDNGKGIAKEDLPHIWDRYYKVEQKHRRSVSGTGLGLSIVKKIINLHDGQYGVLSELGKGSTFWFEIKL